MTERNQPTAFGSRSASSPWEAGPDRGTRDAHCQGRTYFVSRHCGLVLRGSDTVPAQQHLRVRGVPDDVPGWSAGSLEDKVGNSLRGEHRGSLCTGGRHRRPAAGRGTRRRAGHGRNQKSDPATLPHERHFRQSARGCVSPRSPCAPGQRRPLETMLAGGGTRTLLHPPGLASVAGQVA